MFAIEFLCINNWCIFVHRWVRPREDGIRYTVWRWFVTPSTETTD